MPESPADDAAADASLLAALAAIQARGVIGEASLSAAVAHADRYVTRLPVTIRRLADLGSGGGLPGLVIALRRPQISITLVERRRSRADLLRRAVAALRLPNAEVFSGDVRQLAKDRPRSFDAVTARSFAAPAVTARWAGELLLPGGLLAVSEPPNPLPDRWTTQALSAAGLVDLGCDRGIRCLQKVASG
jgi:16S rRNA (guanine527-N7)-methyltransferase